MLVMSTSFRAASQVDMARLSATQERNRMVAILGEQKHHLTRELQQSVASLSRIYEAEVVTLRVKNEALNSCSLNIARPCSTRIIAH
jgi:hypothetical protein